jgi:hypothetical protein
VLLLQLMESAKHSDHNDEPAYVVGQVFFAVFKMGMSEYVSMSF